MEDETNLDVANPRNRIRHVVLPELERSYGGAVAPNLARAADLVRDDSACLDELSDGRYRALVVERPDGIEVNRARLASEPGPILRRILLKALRAVAGDRQVTLEHVQAAVDVLAGACGGTDVPGGRVEPRGEILVLRRQGPPRSDTLNKS
jgi:hypothetical protein